ncbi:ANTAR domain-containing protein [Roseateles koreensis]|uniref:Response regulatory domain-containing protein n=1 Tax=Roseateles koreensis TaxID=2987526 RepID=A0ABT5KW49_9BURK|nr:hypothetical protein [Roseateles koreensis]MDC8787032.1 hypothetical protein [Roseateles koreensis]
MPSLFLLRRCQPSLRKAQDHLSEKTGWHLCGTSEQLRTAEAQIPELDPDVVACDLRLIDGHVCHLAQQMQGWAKRPQLLLLTPSADDLLLFNTLQAGASAYCVEGLTGQRDLTPCLQALMDGRAGMSPRIARECLTAFGLNRSPWADATAPQADALQAADISPTLNAGEGHLLSLLARGLLITEIAHLWQCAVELIEHAVHGVYRKLHGLRMA